MKTSWFFAGGAAAIMFVALVVPGVAGAETDLEAQVQQLLRMVQNLQAQVASQSGGGGGSVSPILSGGGGGGGGGEVIVQTSNCFKFNKNLRIGDYGADVAVLARNLYKEGLLETYNSQVSAIEFDERIAAAVVAFQEKYAFEVLRPSGLKRGTGYVGPSTRAKLNKINVCVTTPAPASAISNTATTPASMPPYPISLRSPHEGDFLVGQSYHVLWSTIGISNEESVRIRLRSESNGQEYNLGDFPNIGAATVTISSDIPTGNYRLEIKAAPSNRGSYIAKSRGVLRVLSSTITTGTTTGLSMGEVRVQGNTISIYGSGMNESSLVNIGSLQISPTTVSRDGTMLTVESYAIPKLAVVPGQTYDVWISGSTDRAMVTIPASFSQQENPTRPADTDRTNSIINLYRTLLRREADIAGLNFWFDSSLSIDEIKWRFMNSAEYRRVAPIVELFNKLLKREPSSAEVNKWYHSGLAIDEISDRLKATDEYTRGNSTVGVTSVGGGGGGGAKALECGTLGDVNGDGVISSADGDAIRAIVVGNRSGSSAERAAADTNGDGNISTLDIAFINLYVNGPRTTFPGCAAHVGVSSVSGDGSGVQSSSITVISPNGGESLEAGSVHRIRWIGRGSVNRIDISLVNADNLEQERFIAGESAPGGYYDWTVPNRPGRWRIRISEFAPVAGTAVVQDRSDYYFTISVASAQPFISVSKNPAVGTFTQDIGEMNVMIGSYQFTASASESVRVSNLSIGLSAGGYDFQNLRLLVASGEFGPTQGVLAGNGSYSFAGTPFTIPAGGLVNLNVYADVRGSATAQTHRGLTQITSCTAVGVSSLTNLGCNATPVGQDVVIAATSVIPQLNVTSPSNGNRFNYGDRMRVRWNHSGFGDTVAHVDVYVVPQDGRQEFLVATNYVVTDNSNIEFVIQKEVTLASGEVRQTQFLPGIYKVRVACQSTNTAPYNRCEGKSDGTFVISSPITTTQLTPVFRTSAPSIITRGVAYQFSASVSGALPNSPVLFYLQRPDGSMKYNGSQVGSTDSRGSFSYSSNQQITIEGKNGRWTSWVSVGGVVSNRQYHNVVGAPVTSTPVETNRPPAFRSNAVGETSLVAGKSGTWVVYTSDPDGGAVTVKANYGDGTSGDSVVRNTIDNKFDGRFSHSFSSAGTYTITFTVTDSAGASADQSIRVTVKDEVQETQSATTEANKVPFVKSISGPLSLNVGQSGTWVVSAVDLDGTFIKFTADFGDQSSTEGVKSAASQVGYTTEGRFTHSFSAEGTYTIKFLIEDVNLASTESSIRVKVEAPETSQADTLDEMADMLQSMQTLLEMLKNGE